MICKIKKYINILLASILFISQSPVYANDTFSDIEPVVEGTESSAEPVLTDIGRIRFVTPNNEVVPLEYITITDEQNIELQLVEDTSDELHYLTFPDRKIGDVLNYSVFFPNRGNVTGIITISETDTDITVTEPDKRSCNLEAVTATTSIDEEINLIDYVKVDDEYDGSIHFSLPVQNIIDGGAVITYEEEVDTDEYSLHKGVFKGKKGTTVYVFADETDMFTGSSTTMQVEITKKDLGEITADQITWDNAEKVFDGTLAATATGSFTTSDGEIIKISAQLQLDELLSGNRNSTIVSSSVIEGQDKYSVSVATGNGPVVHVTPKEVTLHAQDIKVRYGSSGWQAIKEGRLPEGVTLANVITNTKLTEEESAVLNSIDKSTYVSFDIKQDTYNVGTFQDVVTLHISTPENCGFAFKKESDGRLVVLPEITDSDINMWNRLQVDTEASRKYYISPDTIWVGRNAYLGFLPAETEQLYDKVFMKETSPVSSDIYTNGISIPEDATADNTVEAAFYLGNSENSTRTDANEETEGAQDNHIPSGYVKIDANAPAISFSNISAYNENKAIEMAVNQGYTISVSVSDIESGVNWAGYKILSFSTTGRTEIDEAKTDEGWTDLEGNVTLPSEDGNYIVLVRAEDKVGNISYRASGGVVIDTTAPSVNVTLNTDKFYNGDVPFSVNVEDGGNTSGLSEIIITAEANGSQIELVHENINDADDIEKAIENALKALNGSIPSSLNSNNVKLTITIRDRAGNVTTETRTIMIDTTAPKITVSYDDNNPSNNKYFNKTRTATIVFQERNFDPSLAMITLKVGAEEKTIPITEVAGNGIAVITNGSDSEAESDEKSYTDNRTITYVFAFGNTDNIDEDYTIIPSCTDKAGNASGAVEYGESNPTNDFTVDKVKPVMNIVFSGYNGNVYTAANSKESPFYERQSMNISVHIRERNFSQEGLAISFTDANGNPVSATGTWNIGDEAVYTLDTIAMDGIYELKATFKDLAGNEVSSESYHFVVDRTAPTGKITISAADVSTSDNLFSTLGWLFSKTSASVAIESSDATSGVKSVKYMQYHPGSETRGQYQALTLEQLESMEWIDWPGTLTLTADSQTVIYARIEDNAGNTIYINSRDTVVIDNTLPSGPDIKINLPDAPEGYYNSDVPFTIEVTDPLSGGTYAGLQSVTWTVANGTNVTQSGNYDSEFTDKSQRKQSISKQETVEAKKNNKDNIRIMVTATDWAGNTSQNAKTLAIDVTAPVMTVTYDKDTPVNDIYYANERGAVIAVREEHFNPDDITIEPKGKENDGLISNWITDTNDPLIHMCKVKFPKDDEYDFRVEAADMAGNKAEEFHDSFIKDSTAPVVGVTYDNNDVRNEKYYKASRTAIITIDEKNFDDKLFYLKITNEDGDVVESETIEQTDTTEKTEGTEAEDALPLSSLSEGHLPSIGKWVHKNNIHSTMVTFSEDGTYTFELYCTDLAGNRSGTLLQNPFTIDIHAPDIEITGVEDSSANNDTVAPVITFHDLNLNEGEIEVKLSGESHEEEIVQGEIEKIDKDVWRFVMTDIPHEKEMDDIYTLKAFAEDYAGNKSDLEIHFSVNRFGSIYTFDENTEKSLKKYYLKDIDDVVIHETNINGIRNRNITIARDGNTKILKDGEDYTTEEENTGWTVWTYTIPKENFEEEGVYEILIDSIDEAGNKQDNSLKEKPIRFVIDRTAPSLILTGIENGKRYDETAHTFTVNIADNIAVGEAEVLINGEVNATYQASQIRDVNGKIEGTLSDSPEWQNIEVRARDAAGNEAEVQSVSVIVHPTLFKRFMSNKPLLYGAGALAAAGASAFFIFRKKKVPSKQKEKKGNSSEK